MAKPAVTARAGGAATLASPRKSSRVECSFVDADERAFDFGEGLVEDALEDAVLLVGEERGEGVEGGVEVAVDEADELGEVGVADGVAGVGDEGVPGGGVFGGVALDGGGEVLVAEVEDGEADVFALFGDAGAEGGAAEGEAAAAGGHDVVGVAVDVEAEDVAGVGIAAEHGADGVVGADAFEIETAGVDEAAVDFGAVADFGDVAFGAGEDLRGSRLRDADGWIRSKSGGRRRACWRAG